MSSDTPASDAAFTSTIDAVASHLGVSEEDAERRYLGQFSDPAGVAKCLFQIDNPHVSVTEWPYRFIDWTEAAADAKITYESSSFLITPDGHWFDGTP